MLAIFIVLTAVFVFGGHATGQHVTFTDLIPNNWVGFELQNGAGEEMHNPQRDVPRSIIRAGLVAVAAYVVVVAAVILFALSKSQLSSATGFVNAFQLVTGVLPGPLATGLGWIVAIGVVIALASSGGTRSTSLRVFC